MSNDISYLATSFSLSNVAHEAMTSEDTRAGAFAIVKLREMVDEKTFTNLLFEYSAELIATTVSLTTEIFMSETEINAMIKESVSLGEGIS